MEPLSLDQVFCRVKDCLVQLQQSHTWVVDKVDVENIVVIRNIAPKTFPIDGDAECHQMSSPAQATPLEGSLTERLGEIKVEEEAWTDYLAFNSFDKSICKTEMETTVLKHISGERECQKDYGIRQKNDGQRAWECQQDQERGENRWEELGSHEAGLKSRDSREKDSLVIEKKELDTRGRKDWRLKWRHHVRMERKNEMDRIKNRMNHTKD